MKRSMSFVLFVPVAAVVALGVVGSRPSPPPWSSAPAREGDVAVALAPSSRPVPTAPTDDGVLPAHATAFDDQWAGVGRLQPALRDALRAATREAASAGHTLEVNSGWRSPGYQQRLLTDAIATYGSEAAAARWVAPVSASRHVSGDAVDVGPATAAAWLAAHGAASDLCLVYRNEPWHFELRPGANRDGCPELYADASVDPRMQP